MSDGMSDSRAEDGLAREVWIAAFDLKELAVHLCKAVQKARLGHRGWVLARYWIVSEVSMALEGTGFSLVDSAPGKSFENYPDAYDRKLSRRETKMLSLLWLACTCLDACERSSATHGTADEIRAELERLGLSPVPKEPTG